MPRDYKNRNAAASKQKNAQHSPGWVWFIAGLLVGLFIAFLIYLKFGVPVTPLEKPVVPAVVKKKPAVNHAKKKAEEKPQPRFEFYRILPELEVPIDHVQVDEPRHRKNETFLLQVASFRSADDADRLKATLIIKGMSAQIQTVTIDGKTTWYRIRTGPYKSLRELDKARNQLVDEGFNPITVKVAE